MTWVVEQHDQIKGRVSVLSSEVDVSTLTQQVLDNVFIAGSRKQKNKDKNMSCFILLTVGPSLEPVLPMVGGLHERGPPVDAVLLVHVCMLLHHQLDHL